MVPWVGLQCAIVLFPDHTHLLLEAMTMKIIDSVAPFGTYCFYLTNVHRSNRYEVKENKQLIYVAKCKGHKQKAFFMEIRYDCAKRYHILCMNCANGIFFGL